jgi:WS/DGAT/MGAT family acyltransferase
VSTEPTSTDNVNPDAQMPRFEARMSDSEGLMWRLEKDPFLNSTFGNVTVLDRPLNFAAFKQRLERASIAVPRLRQKVRPTPAALGAPRWIDDPEFNIDYHVRRVSLPEPGSLRQLLDLATLIVNDPFERTRPLWQFFVVDGLVGGRGALIIKLHHTVADGQGGVLLSLQFIDLERNAPLPPPLPEAPAPEPSLGADEPVDLLRSSMSDALRVPIGLLKQVRSVLADPARLPALATQANDSLRGLIAQMGEVDAARSPLWKRRSLQRRLETVRVPYRELLDVSRALGGKLNTAFVTAIADGAGAYHRALGAPVESLRTSIAISTRTESSGSNAFSLAKLLVPTSDMSIVERFAAVREALEQAREGAKSASLDTLASLSANLPTSVLTRIARTQSQSIDFATSNVRSGGVPLYIAGGLITENYPVGPLGGVAFNATLLSYNGSLDIGIHIDSAAVEQPELLRDEIERSLNKLIYAAARPATPAPAVTGRPKWWSRLFR